MSYQIVVDSCCDLTDEIKKKLNISSIPLNLYLGDKQIVDDEQLNIDQFIEEMKACKEKVGSAAPSPSLYHDKYAACKQSYVVTLSSKLSSSYSSAVLGADMLEMEDHHVHVFDSKSASAGELLVALYLQDLLEDNIQGNALIESVETFIQQMKTYFVLDNIDNLMKNGRLSKVKGRLISILNIKPLMGSDGDGQIVHYGNCKGQSKIVRKMLETIHESGKQTEGLRAVISHCNNETLAARLKKEMQEQFSFKDIVIVPTGGVSSLYANDKGIILAY